MKEVIGGKIYNTETATWIEGHWNGLGENDFNHCREELYRKRTTGEYFLYGEGGASSRWGENVPSGGWCEGAGILPLTDAEALEWAEQYMAADDIIELFEITEE